MKLTHYRSRKLYDPSKRERVTLEQVHQAVVQGEEVAVTEAVTGQDHTAAVYVQLLVQAAERGDAIPLEKLRAVVAELPVRPAVPSSPPSKFHKLLEADGARHLGARRGR